MRRRIVVATVIAFVAAALAAPATANAPKGQGLQTFGDFQCGALGTVTIFGPARGPVGFTTTGLHLVALSFSGTFTDLEGNVFAFSESFGRKEGLTTTYTCTATFVHPGEGTERITVVAGIVPPTS